MEDQHRLYAVMAFSRFANAIARHRLANGDPQRIIEAATELLAQGVESSSLVDLAGYTSSGRAELEGIIDGALLELGFGTPSALDYAAWITDDIATQIGSGSIDAIDGAREIKRLVDMNISDDGPWRKFAVLVDQWDESPKHQTGYREDIEQHAKSLQASVRDST